LHIIHINIKQENTTVYSFTVAIMFVDP